MEYGSKPDFSEEALHKAAMRIIKWAIDNDKSDRRICTMLGISQERLDRLKLENQQADRAHNQ